MWFSYVVLRRQLEDLQPVADPKILKRGGAEDNLSAPSSFMANAHNDL